MKRAYEIAEPYVLCLAFWALWFAVIWAMAADRGKQLDGWN